jgi:hypothetical protein
MLIGIIGIIVTAFFAWYFWWRKPPQKEKALFYFNRALEIFKQIGAQEEIAITKENIKLLSDDSK